MDVPAGVLEKSLVIQAAALYGEESDSGLFGEEFRRPFLDRGCLTLEELARIVEWKSQRQKTNVRKNAPTVVEAVTRQAFTCPEPWLAVWILSYLSGVSTRMASAILTVYDPDRYTVMDVRAWEGLEILGLLEGLGLSKLGGIQDVDLDSPQTYAAYLVACQQLASDVGVPLRTLDRCLWVVGKLGQKVFSISDSAFQ